MAVFCLHYFCIVQHFPNLKWKINKSKLPKKKYLFNLLLLTTLTHLETDFVRKFFRVLICWTCWWIRRIRRRRQRWHRKYVRQTVQPVQTGQIRVRFRVYWCWKHGNWPLDIQHVLLQAKMNILSVFFFIHTCF